MSNYYSDLSADDSSSAGEEDEDNLSENEKESMHNILHFNRKSPSSRDYGRTASPRNNRKNNKKKENSLLHNQQHEQQQQKFPTTDHHHQRVILHLDIDCFYCQCEHLDRNLPNSQPIAIGQKHIIVTSNYAARKLGVKKLQGREDAKKACPQLLIVEGSDLERYRRHGRKVYETFRECIHRHQTRSTTTTATTAITAKKLDAAVRRGRGMDEMQADVSILVDSLMEGQQQQSSSQSSLKNNDKSGTTKSIKIYVYGEQQETATLTEDQTGAEAVVGPYDVSMELKQQQQQQQSSSCSISASSSLMMPSIKERSMCQKRLTLAATELGHFIQQTIQEKTGFTTTIGISINPLLAKLASDLQKPLSINLLYPWRAALPSPLIASMPLRKIPDVGYKTIKLLKPALDEFHNDHTDDNKNATTFWTCGDLLKLPISEVRRCLQSEEQIRMILQRCQGVDTTPILDDGGEAPKTVSCENSFRRGTVVTPQAVWKGMEELYKRLPRLLKDRRDWSNQPTKAYPTTIRLTCRVVDSKLQRQRPRRPFVTRSKQVPFRRGKQLLEESNSDKQARLIQEVIRPLVQSLVLHSPDPGGLNVTRLNIAVTNFQDVGGNTTAGSSGSVTTGTGLNPTKVRSSQPLLEAFATQNATTASQIPGNRSAFGRGTQQHLTKSKQPSLTGNPRGASSSSSSFMVSFSSSSSEQNHQSSTTSFKRPRSQSSSDSCGPPKTTTTTTTTTTLPKIHDLPSGIDPETLAELPPEMVQQIVRDYRNVLQSKAVQKQKRPYAKQQPTKAARIDQFFKRK